MRHLVLGTAGHIDHGKSALVEALSGTDPDRLKEEKERGITIDLGFADLELAEGVVSFVDVPGHERFVRNMVAGATGIDAVLLVVAADQGVQPQTREHLDICRLLGLRQGIVALTKSDLVDDELLQVSELELRELLDGTFLEDAPVVSVSARTGHGLAVLREALGTLFGQVPERSADGPGRLPVDRAFVLHGFGTVVTGTLASGTLHEGGEIEVLPSRRRARIRGLQVHRCAVKEGRAGQRLAVNLQGVDCREVPRGSTLATSGALPLTRRLWARVRLLEDAPAALRDGGPVRFHQGTCERGARLRVLREEDGVLHAELYLAEETVLVPGDRFILRRPAPVDTVGGGTVTDVSPPRTRDHSAEDFAADSTLPERSVAVRLRRAGIAGLEIDSLARELGLTRGRVERIVSDLEGSGSVRAAARWFDAEAWSRAANRVVEELSMFHAAEPLLRGLSREDLRGRTCREMPQDAWRHLLERMAEERRLRLQEESVALAEHNVELKGGDRELADRLERQFVGAGLEPPELEEAAGEEDPRRARQISELLVSSGVLTRIHDGRLFSSAALGELRERLRRHSDTSRTIDVAGFKRLAGVTRKNAIPLLEHLDKERVTRRAGNLREILID